MEQAITPTPARERIDLLDILRGFALLGILIVNMGIFSFPSSPSSPERHAAIVSSIMQPSSSSWR